MLNQINLFGVIGDQVLASAIKQQMDAMDQSQPLLVRIFSEGGSVIDGFALYTAFKEYPGPKKAIIEPAAFSIASYIAMAFDDVEISENGYLMIHNPWSETEGDDQDHIRAAETLAKLKESMVVAYCEKTGKSRDEMLAVMAKETWLSAEEALAQGYVNRITSAKAVDFKAAAKLKNMPQGVVQSLRGDGSDAGKTRETTQEKTMSTSQPVAASLSEIKAAFPKAKAEFVLKCLERSLPMASVMTEMISMMEEENNALRAEMEQMKAKAMEEEAAKAKAMEDEEEKAKAVAQAKAGVKPVAKAGGSTKPSAKAQWYAEVNRRLELGISRVAAIKAIEVEMPGLRQQMLDEVNA